jgi:selenocysteine-specific elongation factor
VPGSPAPDPPAPDPLGTDATAPDATAHDPTAHDPTAHDPSAHDPSAPDQAAAGRPATELPLTLGTAGHIDHGKTALVTRLTGTNTDRLREERERGISIELGYAELELPGGQRLSVVDVPGHERFVRTMVAGASGIDLFLLVVAADDGVMPQTVEHLAVIELLGVERGVVALTKADLVDDELLEMARNDVARFLSETPYAGAPVVVVSARDGRGLAELRDALARVAGEAATGRRTGPARLPVDRVFTLKGIGTVVTGTLWRGAVRAGDRLIVQPSGISVTVRSVQMHERAVEAASAGRRVALGLRGADRATLERGVWLVGPEAARRHVPSRSFAAAVRLVASARTLKTGQTVRLHHGTAQHLAHLAFLDRRELRAGEEAVTIVRLDGLAALEPHDRFILRSLSPGQTVGGGVVLDAAPRRFRERGTHLAFLAAVAADDLSRACLLLAADHGFAGVAAADLAAVGMEPEEASSTLAALAGAGELETAGDGALRDSPTSSAAPSTRSSRPDERRWFAAGTLARVAAAAGTVLERRAGQHPDNPFVALAELAAAVPRFPLEALTVVAARLVEQGAVVERGGGYGLAGAGDALAPAQEALAARVGERLTAARFAPPTLASLEEELESGRRDLVTVLEVLTRRGLAVRADKDLWFARLVQITLAQYRDELGTGRRHAQALLEIFDREGLTQRRGETRVLRGRR